MKKTFTLFATIACSIIGLKAQNLPAPSAGNLIIYRVGDGTTALTTASAPVFLDVHSLSTSGIAPVVKSLSMPTDSTALSNGNHIFSASGTGSSEGLLSRSVDGNYIVFTGYQAPVGTTAISSTASRTIARIVATVNADGVINTSTALPGFSTGSNPRCATSVDGKSFYICGGAGGVRYAPNLGDTTSISILSTPSAPRAVVINNGQLYESAASLGSGKSKVSIGAVGTGLPTAKATFVAVPGVDTVYNGTSVATTTQQFVFLTVNGNTVLYIADNGSDTVHAVRGIQKYSLVSGVWAYNGTIPTKKGTLGITGFVNGNTVNLFATSASKLFAAVDNSGYNSPVLSDSAIIIDTAVANTQFRGVAYVESSFTLPVNLSAPLTASSSNNATLLSWTVANEVNVKSFDIERSVDGLAYSLVASISSAGIGSYSYTDNNSLEGVVYYRLKVVDYNGSSSYSNVAVVNTKASLSLSVYPNPVGSSTVVSHNIAAKGATLTITSIEGKILSTYLLKQGSTKTFLDYSRLAKGIYMLTLENNGNKTMIKIVK